MERKRSALESDYLVPISKITVLINTITGMAKNPSIESDLSQVLDEFLEKLRECDKYLENGIFNMNFAEAALLLQSSADLYSKKVDLLWDMIFDYQKRLLLSEEQNGDKNQEIEKVEERKRKYKRKRKTNSDEKESAKLVNSFSFGNVENTDYLSQSYEFVDLSEEWGKFHMRNQTNDNLHESVNKPVNFQPSNAVYNEDNEYIGRYDQFHSMSLIEDIFYLEEQKLLSNDYNCITRMRIDTYVINDFLLERAIPTNKSLDDYSSDLKEYINNFYESNKHVEKDVPVCSTQTRKSFVTLERLPLNIIRDKLRRATVDSLLDEDHPCSVSEHCPSPTPVSKSNEMHESFGEVTTNLENRSKSCSQDSAFYEDDDQDNDMEVDPATHVTADSTEPVEMVVDSAELVETVADGAESVETMTDSAQEMVTVSNIASSPGDVTNNEKHVETCNNDSEAEPSEEITNSVEHTITSVDAVSPIGVEQFYSNCVKPNVTTVAEHVLRRIATRQKIGTNWSSILNAEEHVESKTPKPQRKRPISHKALLKLATGLTVKHRDFEMFCRMQYRAAEGEGTVPQDLSESEDSDDEDNNDETSDEEEIIEPLSPSNDEQEESEEEEEISDEIISEALETSENDPPESSEKSIPERTKTPDLPDILHPSISPTPELPNCSTSENVGVPVGTSTPRHSESASSLSNADLEQEEYRKHVREWRSFIVPKLRMLENRADFDIHEYGSKIIEPSEIGEERHFKDIVRGKSAAEVARYFIATLQLANTYNIEITGVVPGKIANDTFRIKTLDKTKHHEMLEEYQAPSEESFQERLERVKALNPSVAVHSTPDGSPPAKRMRTSYCSRKKLF